MPRRVQLLAATLQLIGGGLGWSIIPPLMPLIGKELSLTPAMSGMAWGATPLGIALASVFGGAVVDRFGARWVAGLAMLAGALACASRAWVHDVYGLTAAMFAFGLHIGFVAPSLPKALAGHVPLKHLGRANGLTVLAYALGTAATVLTARTLLLPLAGGWRPLMVAIGATLGLAGVLWMALYRDRSFAAQHHSFTAVLKLGRDRQLLRVAGVQFLLFGGYLALLGSLIPALISFGMDPKLAGGAVALWLCCAAAANLTGPWLSDRIGRRLPFIKIGAVIAGTSLMLLALFPSAHTAWLLAVAALGGGCFAPLVLAMPVELPSIGRERAGAAIGLLMLVGQMGGFLLPVMTGQLATHVGFSWGLFALAVAHLAILIPARGLKETGTARALPATEPNDPGEPADLPLVDGEPMPAPVSVTAPAKRSAAAVGTTVARNAGRSMPVPAAGTASTASSTVLTGRESASAAAEVLPLAEGTPRASTRPLL
ncbi:MAG: MFS transporter [Myxococcaceae bacterium]